MKKLLSLVVAILASVGLTGGFVAASSGSLDETGPDSENLILFEDESNVSLNNTTGVNASVSTNQEADSGDAYVKYNTTGGDAETGDAENEASLEADLSVDNSGSSGDALACACGSGGGGHDADISTTGPNSENKVIFKNKSNVSVNNTTTVSFNNNVNQNADSGNASVWNNTTGGNATTGNASNSSSTVFSLSVTN